MKSIKLGLITREGDQLGHLVRAVQMLRSYGGECDVQDYYDVISVGPQYGEGALCAVIEATSTATLEALRGICRETQWALGDKPETLQVQILEYDGHEMETDAVLAKAIEGAPDSALYLGAEQFAQSCDWGQHSADGEDQLIGEWPSADGY